jgi:hypothetical protein
MNHILNNQDKDRLGQFVRSIEYLTVFNQNRRLPVNSFTLNTGDVIYPTSRKDLTTGNNVLTRSDRNKLLWWADDPYGGCYPYLPEDVQTGDTFWFVCTPATTPYMGIRLSSLKQAIVLPHTGDVTGVENPDGLCHGYWYDWNPLGTGTYEREEFMLKTIPSGGAILCWAILQYIGTSYDVVVDPDMETEVHKLWSAEILNSPIQTNAWWFESP